MNKYLEEKRNELAEKAVSKLPERYDGRYHPRVVGISWYRSGFNAGIKLAIEIMEKHYLDCHFCGECCDCISLFEDKEYGGEG